MKYRRKLVYGLMLVLAAIFLTAIHPHSRVHADTPTGGDTWAPTNDVEISSATFQFVDRGTIQGTFTSTTDGSKHTILFTDSDTHDNKYNYKTPDKLYPNWCGEQTDGGITFVGQTPSGGSLTGPGFGDIGWYNPRNISQVTAKVDIGYRLANNKCQYGNVFPQPVTNADLTAYVYYQWSGTSLNVDTSTLGSQGTPKYGNFSEPTADQADPRPAGSLPLFMVSGTGNCPGGVIALGSGQQGTLYELSSSSNDPNGNNGDSTKNFSALSGWKHTCFVRSINFSAEALGYQNSFGSLKQLDGKDFQIAGTAPDGTSFNPGGTQPAGTPPAPTPVGVGQTCDSGADCPTAGPNKGVCQARSDGKTPDCKTSNASNTGQECEAKDTSLLGWIMCPVLRLIDNTAGWLNDQIEAQLNFNEKGLLCGGNTTNCTQSQTYKGWSAIRNVATGLLVLVMLVMVISEAMGGQFLDAYTIRKAMPKLVVAILAIQLSWPIAYWLIGISNDLGQGIASLLYDIFHGGTPISLQDLLGNGAGQGIGFASLFITVAVGAYLIFTSLALAVPVLLGIIIAVFVLILRQILILLCVLSLPIALVLWILPGTERYWKMWSSNFTKLLLMFPMIMTLIVMGRVFASLSSGGNINHSGNTFWSFVLVVVAYFGPYFFLPQTFKWGGSLMAMAGQAAQRARSKLSETPQKFLRDRQEKLGLERAYKSQRRMVNRLRGKNPYAVEGSKLNPFKAYKRAWNYGIAHTMDQLRSGQWDPTLGVSRPKWVTDANGKRRLTMFDPHGAMRTQQYQKYISAGRSQIAERGEGFQKIMRGAIEEIGTKEQKAEKLYRLYQQAHSYEERMAIMRELATPEVDGGKVLTQLKRELAEGQYEFAPGQSLEARKRSGMAHWTDAANSNTDAFRRVSPHLNEGYAYDEKTGTYSLPGMPGVDPGSRAAQHQRDEERFRDRPMSQLLHMTSAGWQRYTQIFGEQAAAELYTKIRTEYPTQAGDIAEGARAKFETAFEHAQTRDATGRVTAFDQAAYLAGVAATPRDTGIFEPERDVSKTL